MDDDRLVFIGVLQLDNRQRYHRNTQNLNVGNMACINAADEFLSSLLPLLLVLRLAAVALLLLLCNTVSSILDATDVDRQFPMVVLRNLLEGW